MSEAYIQSESLALEELVRPQKMMYLNEGYLLRISKPLYGLAESGDYGAKTFGSI